MMQRSNLTAMLEEMVANTPALSRETVEVAFLSTYAERLTRSMEKINRLPAETKAAVGMIIEETQRYDAIHFAAIVRAAGRPELAEQMVADIPDFMRYAP